MNQKIPICAKCAAYINPFVKFKNLKMLWECNLCGVDNETPSYYLEKEFKCGSYEIVANSEYSLLI
jgi:hypothetical protein